MANYRNELNSVLNIVKAIADENRLRILMCLGPEELCVCRIIAMVGLAPSTVSKHLYILRQAGLIDSSKRGRWIYYRTADDNKLASGLRQWLGESLRHDGQIGRDRQSLKSIMKLDAQDVCRDLKCNGRG